MPYRSKFHGTEIDRILANANAALPTMVDVTVETVTTTTLTTEI